MNLTSLKHVPQRGATDFDIHFPSLTPPNSTSKHFLTFLDLLAHHLLSDKVLLDHPNLSFSTMENSWHQSQPEGSSSESFTAPSKVFATPELLEMILVHLPHRDLLMCECISKTWHAAIKKSNTLQGKLFYRCHPVTLSKDMDKLNLEINPFFLLVQRHWSYRKEKGAKYFEDIDYPEASWKRMYLSRPAVCKIGIEKSRDSSTSDLSFQVIQNDTIKMSHLRDRNVRPPNSRTVIRLSQSDGIRMHHLQGMDLSIIFFLTLTGDKFLTVANTGDRWLDCPSPSLRQFYDMYVNR